MTVSSYDPDDDDDPTRTHDEPRRHVVSDIANARLPEWTLGPVAIRNHIVAINRNGNEVGSIELLIDDPNEWHRRCADVIHALNHPPTDSERLARSRETPE